jgi:hypothetical protein
MSRIEISNETCYIYDDDFELIIDPVWDNLITIIRRYKCEKGIGIETPIPALSAF